MARNNQFTIKWPVSDLLLSVKVLFHIPLNLHLDLHRYSWCRRNQQPSQMCSIIKLLHLTPYSTISSTSLTIPCSAVYIRKSDGVTILLYKVFRISSVPTRSNSSWGYDVIKHHKIKSNINGTSEASQGRVLYTLCRHKKWFKMPLKFRNKSASLLSL